MTITRDNLPKPSLPRETVVVGALGGEVIVRGLLLRERMALHDALKAREAAGEVLDGGAVNYALLSAAVVLDDDAPVYTAGEWEIFASTHTEDFLGLLTQAQDLNGFNREALKKS